MKKVPMWLFLLVIYINVVLVILFGWSILHVYKNGKRFSPGMKNAIISIARLPTAISNVYGHIFPSDRSASPLAIDNDKINNGLTKTEKGYQINDYILVSSFDSLEKQAVVKLVGLSEGKTLHKWKPDIAVLLGGHDRKNKKIDKVDKDNYRIFHPLLLENGGIIFNDRLQLVKIDKNAKIVWSNNHVFHHSIEQDAEGNLWCSSMIEDSKLYQDFIKNFRDDAIAKVSATDGKILFQKSVAQILADNGYEALTLGIGPFRNDPLHLNDIQPALTDSKYWQKGDLLVSIKNRSTVFLYRPETNKILWLKTGPWLNQHDCDFLDDHRIGIFENHGARENPSADVAAGYSNEMIFDFNTSQVSTPYTNLFKNAGIGAGAEGSSRVLANGDLYVEAANNGRIIIGDAQKVKLEYAERLNDKEISMFNWSRYLAAEEFSKVNFLNN